MENTSNNNNQGNEQSKKVNPQEYVKNHNLDKTISEMYNSLLYERSSNPQLFMVSAYL